MKHESASEARSELARRITERAKRMMEPGAPVIVPMSGEPLRALSQEERHSRDEAEALRIAASPYTNALRVYCNNSQAFYPFPSKAPGDISRATIQRLVDKGQMAWGNSMRSFAVLTEGGREELKTEPPPAGRLRRRRR